MPAREQTCRAAARDQGYFSSYVANPLADDHSLGWIAAEACEAIGVELGQTSVPRLGMPSEMKRLKQLDEENAKLKKLVADLSLYRAMLQDVIRRKF